MSTPSQVPYYSPRRQRSLFGPIVLIAIGVILLLRNFGVISTRGFWIWFSNYWPILLILLGVIKLIEYMWARASGNPSPRLGAGAIVFLVFFIIFGITTTRVSRVDWHGLGQNIGIDDDPDVSDFFNGMFGSRYDFSDNFSQPVNATQMRILTSRGDIKITPSADGQIHAIVQKAIRSDSQNNANQLNESTHPKIVQQGDMAVLDLSSGNYQRGEFDLDLQLPPKMAVSVTTHHGDITVSERDGSVDLTTDKGDLNFDQIKGDVVLHVRGGDITGKDIGGNVTVDGSVQNTDISDVKGSLTMTGTYWGDLQLARIAKHVHFTTARTNLEFNRLDGDFNMQPDDLSANSITGPFRLETRSKGVHLEDVTGDIHIHDSNANVELQPKSPLAPIEVNNSHGNISLSVPENAGFQLDAASMDGNINTDFDLPVNNERNNPSVRANVGKGGPLVTLKAERGNIEVKKQ
jgi:putative adhesin/cell wall-active antibiotic response 4TMS protein YvqF